MMLSATINVGVRKFLLGLDTSKPDRNYADEDYIEWIVSFPDGPVFDVTMWNDDIKSASCKGTVMIYADMGAFEDDSPMGSKHIKFREK